MKEKQSRIGILVLIVKIGLKFGGVALKLLKSTKVVKVGLAAASFAEYAYLSTWQFALMILALIGIHEYGHVWAMKRCGLKTKGFYFIPFFGGMAVPGEAFRTEREEAYTAIMGPIWGLGVSAATALLYVITKNPLFAAGSSWMAMVNVINLLPIYPLDGGRMLKTITFSIHSGIGLVVLVLGLLAGLVGSIMGGLYLLTFFFVLSAVDVVPNLWKRHSKLQRPDKPTMKPLQVFNYACLYIILAGILLGLMYSMNHVPGASHALDVLKDK